MDEKEEEKVTEGTNETTANDGKKAEGRQMANKMVRVVVQEKELYCCGCGKALQPGEHVYPCLREIWHEECATGECLWVVGSDMEIRRAGSNQCSSFGDGYETLELGQGYFRAGSALR